MAGNITNELVSKLGMKNLSKGIKVDVQGTVVKVDVALNICFGHSTSVAASPAMMATTSSAIRTSPRLSSFIIYAFLSSAMITPPKLIRPIIIAEYPFFAKVF